MPKAKDNEAPVVHVPQTPDPPNAVVPEELDVPDADTQRAERES